MKLQAGERYRMRNGENVYDLIDNTYNKLYPFISKRHGFTWTNEGERAKGSTCGEFILTDIIEHIPKEKSMSEKMIMVKQARNIMHQAGVFELEVTLSEAIRLGDEAKRIMEEDKIKAGDWVVIGFGGKIERVEHVGSSDCISTKNSIYQYGYAKKNLTKITNPAHIQALTEIYEANK